MGHLLRWLLCRVSGGHSHQLSLYLRQARRERLMFALGVFIGFCLGYGVAVVSVLMPYDD